MEKIEYGQIIDAFDKDHNLLELCAKIVQEDYPEAAYTEISRVTIEVAFAMGYVLGQMFKLPNARAQKAAELVQAKVLTALFPSGNRT